MSAKAKRTVSVRKLGFTQIGQDIAQLYGKSRVLNRAMLIIATASLGTLELSVTAHFRQLRRLSIRASKRTCVQATVTRWMHGLHSNTAECERPSNGVMVMSNALVSCRRRPKLMANGEWAGAGLVMVMGPANGLNSVVMR